MTKQPFSHFDLPREFLSREGHYAPPKARNEAEIVRRRSLPAGTLLLEQQARGIDIAGKILSRVEAGKDMAFTTRLLGMAAINSSWYVFGQKAPDVMRRRLYLPKMADQETDWRQSAASQYDETLQNLYTAHDLAGRMVKAHTLERLNKRQAHAFGRQLGNVALHLAVLGDGQTTIAGNAFEVQEQVRQKGLELLDSSTHFVLEYDSHPSFAQLANPDSPLAVHWRREAPNGAFTAYTQSLDEIA